MVIVNAEIHSDIIHFDQFKRGVISAQCSNIYIYIYSQRRVIRICNTFWPLQKRGAKHVHANLHTKIHVTEILTIIDPSPKKQYPCATGSIIVGISVSSYIIYVYMYIYVYIYVYIYIRFLGLLTKNLKVSTSFKNIPDIFCTNHIHCCMYVCVNLWDFTSDVS